MRTQVEILATLRIHVARLKNYLSIDFEPNSRRDQEFLLQMYAILSRLEKDLPASVPKMRTLLHSITLSLFKNIRSESRSVKLFLPTADKKYIVEACEDILAVQAWSGKTSA